MEQNLEMKVLLVLANILCLNAVTVAIGRNLSGMTKKDIYDGRLTF